MHVDTRVRYSKFGYVGQSGCIFWCLAVEALSRLEQRACVRWLLYDSEDENLGPVNAIK
jgi:hypothetical protein